MRRIILDTETTGLDPKQGHRIIEIAAIILDGREVSKQHFHRYMNPERDIEESAVAVHGLTYERLQNEPKFADIAQSFLEFIKDDELVIHNAPFDMGFINHELKLLGLPALKNPVLDTLKMARDLHPGKKNNLNALCSRYDIDNAHRVFHGALLDTELLAEVYLAMTRGQESLLDDALLSEPEQTQQTFDHGVPSVPLRVLMANEDELAAHEKQLCDIDKASGACAWLEIKQKAKTEVQGIN